MTPIGFGSALSQRAQLADLLLLPERGRVPRVVDVEHRAFAAGEAHRLDEAVAPLAGPEHVGEAREAELLVAPLDEVLGAQVADADVVGPDLRHPGNGSTSFRSTRGILSSAQAATSSGVVWRLMTPCHFLLRSQRVGLGIGLVVVEGRPGVVGALEVRDALQHRHAFLKARQENQQHMGFLLHPPTVQATNP
jgi:hypothetical protein